MHYFMIGFQHTFGMGLYTKVGLFASPIFGHVGMNNKLRWERRKHSAHKALRHPCMED